MYQASEVYLSTRITPSIFFDARITPSISQLNIFKHPGETEFSLIIGKGQTIVDTFEGMDLVWEFVATKTQQGGNDREGYNQSSDKAENRSAMLSFHKQHKDKVQETYLPYVVERANAIKIENRMVKIYSLGRNFKGVNLNHPSTFDTLAMDPVLKKELKDDLDRFIDRKVFYRRVGKIWKRGYLLWWSTSFRSNSDIRRMLTTTSNAEIAEELIKTHDVVAALSGLINFLTMKKHTNWEIEVDKSIKDEGNEN
ncbi:hypothetical protein Tsubulata_043819 [Turnera subulata]|uniref:AAA-type ATPase N-terminal domain-containing protein n=1 Tax=Turnera subulata TaxID=218843 RepID=A0A9Q0G5C0_9ROSI|nr:hypothetical protein Tsubulata_043819 [Turnera subulata]